MIGITADNAELNLRNEDRLRLESAATECEFDDCGMVSIRTLVPSTTPSTAPEPSGEPAGFIALLAPR